MSLKVTRNVTSSLVSQDGPSRSSSQGGLKTCRSGLEAVLASLTAAQVSAAIKFGWLDRVYEDLEAENYAVGSTVLGAHVVGAPQVRQRLFWLAHSAGWRQQQIEGNRLQGQQDALCSEGSCVHSMVEVCGHSSSRTECESAGDSCGESTGGSRDSGDHWGKWDVVHCWDGRTRRIPKSSSGVRVLAHGVPESLERQFAREFGMEISAVRAARKNRAGQVKGYGNAIVPGVAAAVIEEFLKFKPK
jgi:DNA (cytosine-5)-methyltransferase 1